MTMKIYLSILALIPTFVFAASFDCSKASSITEKTICNNPTISELDNKLAEAYKNAKSKTSDESKLKSEQLAWIKESRTCGGDSNCLEKSYKDRIAALGGTSVANKSMPQPEIKSAPVAQAPVAPPVQAAKKEMTQQEMTAKLANTLGTDGWGKCAAASASVTVLTLQNKKMSPNIKQANEELGAVLGEIRKYFLSRGVTDAVLGPQIKVWGGRMTSGDYALDTLTNCYTTMERTISGQ